VIGGRVQDPDEGTRYRREFAARRGRQVWITALFMVPIVVVAVARLRHSGPLTELMGVPIRTWLIGYFAFMLVLIVASFRNWRCPACGGPLSRTLNQRRCRRCGLELQ
jgi:hypothetical protein